MAAKRLFVGTFLSQKDMDLLGQLAQYKERLTEEWPCKPRFVRAEKLHLTWVFLGDVDETLVPEISEKLSRFLTDRKSFDLTYEIADFWPRALVVRPNGTPQWLSAFAEGIKASMRPYAEKLEKRYKPHITILRVDRWPPRMQRFPEWFPVHKHLPIRHHIDRIDLIESHLGTTRDYESIAGWHLK